jgi:hypothetical protein
LRQEEAFGPAHNRDIEWLATGSGAQHAFREGATWCICRMFKRTYALKPIATDVHCKVCIRIKEQHDAR